ncbi:MAG: maleylpyruvate isomerase N-terminal domain-containing protein, partial [Actinobacteria bacterium]|nr:maleylpyruvate isomerase N-terminal domain-containing protein [Actinomycetota bacterium]
HQPVADGRWTIRDVTAHLTTVFGLYTEFAAGATSPYQSLDRESCAAASEQLLADISEDDPGKLAGLLIDSAERFLDESSELPGDHPVMYHCDLNYHVFGLTGTLLGDVLLHGYDIAARLQRPWRIDPTDAGLVLGAYGPLYHLIVDPHRTKGLTVTVSIELRGSPPFVARFRDGQLSFEPAGGDPVDATISADPAAFLMVGSGRLGRSAAIALGLMELGGPRPDVAMAFPDYFAYP